MKYQYFEIVLKWIYLVTFHHFTISQFYVGHLSQLLHFWCHRQLGCPSANMEDTRHEKGHHDIDNGPFSPQIFVTLHLWVYPHGSLSTDRIYAPPNFDCMWNFPNLFSSWVFCIYRIYFQVCFQVKAKYTNRLDTVYLCSIELKKKISSQLKQLSKETSNW